MDGMLDLIDPRIATYCAQGYDIFNFNAFLINLVPLTIAPAFITASIYLCLSRIVTLYDPTISVSRLKPLTYSYIFVTADFVSLLLQAAGGAIAAISDKKSTTDMGGKSRALSIDKRLY